MQIIEWPQFLEDGLGPDKKPASMTIGIFDGVHRGHRSLIELVVSHNKNFIPVIITFRQNHKTMGKKQETENNEQKNIEVVQKLKIPDNSIQTLNERLEIFSSLGIKATVVIDYTEEFRKMPGIEFFKILLKHVNIGFFAVGNDFRCGYKLDTGADEIKKIFTSNNIPVEFAQQVTEGLLPISSSRIRAAIAAGDFSLAQAMLGYVIK